MNLYQNYVYELAGIVTLNSNNIFYAENEFVSLGENYFFFVVSNILP